MKTNQMFSKTILAAALVTSLGVAQVPQPRPAVPPIPKAPDKTDFAQVEYKYPIDPRSLAALNQADFQNHATWTQEALDQLYARLKSGPIPNGVYQGDIVFAPGGGVDRLRDLARAFNLQMGPFNDIDKLKDFAKLLWKGKHFYKDKLELRNLMVPSLISEFVNQVPPHLREQMPALPLINQVLALASLPPLGRINGHNYYELFPAKLYCGQSLLDSRRESVIIDYAFGDELVAPAVRNTPDIVLGGRKGLKIRDEIRMVRPGLYLGRAYMGSAFALTFTLYNEEAAKAVGPVEQECFAGTQQPAPVAQNR